MSETTFETFMNKVNNILIRNIMLDSEDLPDIDYYTLYEDGYTPQETVEEVLYESGAPESLIEGIM